MQPQVIAYFSIEVGLDPEMPTYAGGLGILAGDTLRAAADLAVPLVGVSLLHRQGYLKQTLTDDGWQQEAPVEWPVERFLHEMPQRVHVSLDGREVQIRAWRRIVTGAGERNGGTAGGVVPVFFLDTDLAENDPRDRTLTHHLYGGDARYRLCQEAVLGIGGVRMLHALGYENVARYHMNEGHAALLAAELLDEELARIGRPSVRHDDVEAVRNRCVFTTHTPVPAGHDQFPTEMAMQVLGRRYVTPEWQQFLCHEGRLNMTFAALNLSRYVNGVAKRHAEVSRLMFAGYGIDAITNGVHAGTWVGPAFAKLFDEHIPDWRKDNFSLRYAHNLPKDQAWRAHAEAKAELLRHVAQRTGVEMDRDTLTLGFARRAAAYKRADLLLRDLDQLKRITAAVGPIQIIYAGKAHPRDAEGKELIKRIVAAGRGLQGSVRLVYLPDYDMRLARLITAGVDVWLNTPQPPLEASGTSGMKAALNGVPSLSVLDGWWLEGCIEGVTGWAIGDDHERNSPPADGSADMDALYGKLEFVVLPTFYDARERFVDMMLHCIALNGSFFNTHRMLQEYATKAYLR